MTADDIREIKLLAPPTRSQLVALLGIRNHGHPWAYCFGRAQHGGFSLVVSVILKRGWATGATTTWTLTERGKKLLEALEETPTPTPAKDLGPCRVCGHPFVHHWYGHSPCAHSCDETCRVEPARHRDDCCRCPLYEAP